MSWSVDVLDRAITLQTVRFIAFDIDTFIDFYESLFNRQQVQRIERRQFTEIEFREFGEHADQVSAALSSLQNDPRSVITICRNIIERIAKYHSPVPYLKLYEVINSLKDRVPGSIYSYLTTCRILGNFANHDFQDFYPSRRDAEAVLLLTVRIVEWHMGERSDN